MDYTREPIIETVITPKEGCKLVLRNTKGTSQEEYFVDAVEVVTFGTTHFFRSLERPKPFLIPATDFEVLEVREPRMILKAATPDRGAIKIGKENHPPQKPHKEPHHKESHHKEPKEQQSQKPQQEGEGQGQQQGQGGDRRRNRRSSRRRRDREEGENNSPVTEGQETAAPLSEGELPPAPRFISPPPTLISETLLRYRENEEFRGAFYDKEAEKEGALEEQQPAPRMAFPENGDFSDGDDLLFGGSSQEVRSSKKQERDEELLDAPPLVDEE